MLIEKSHFPWITSAGAAGILAGVVFVCSQRHTPGGLTGGSVVGLWLGIAGGALVIYAALLSVLRRFPHRRRITSWPVGISVSMAVVLLAMFFLLNRLTSDWPGPMRWVINAFLLLLSTTALLLGLVRVGWRQTWMRGHIWLGTLGAFLLLLHGGWRWGGPLEQVLWVALALTMVTGVYGLALQHILPRAVATRFPHEVPFEQIPHVCGLLRRQADALIDATCGTFAAVAPGSTGAPNGLQGDGESRRQLRSLYEAELRPFLTVPYPRSLRLGDPLAAEALFATIRQQAWPADDQRRFTELEEICAERRQIGEQERLHRLLHAWLLVHVPLSLALIVLGAFHAVTSLYY
jgi:hypothetical protein